MLLRDSFPELRSWTVRIIASDISPTMLERCRAGRYSQLEVNRGLPAPTLIKHMTRDGAAWVVSPDLRSMISTQRMNLADSWPALPKFDLIFMRNVLRSEEHTSELQSLMRI